MDDLKLLEYFHTFQRQTMLRVIGFKLDFYVMYEIKVRQELDKAHSSMKRLKSVLSTYFWTFIAVMIANQLVFFGFCLNLVCLAAATPHVLLISWLIGTWLNKNNNWGRGSDTPSAPNITREATPSPNLKPAFVKPDNSILSGLTDLTERMKTKAIIQRAKNEYCSERDFIKCWLTGAEELLKIEAKRNENPEVAAIYAKLSLDWDSADKKQPHLNTAKNNPRKLAQPCLTPQERLLENSDELQKILTRLAVEHIEFLESVKLKLHGNPDLTRIFNKNVYEADGAAILEHLETIDLPKSEMRDDLYSRKVNASITGLDRFKLEGPWKAGYAFDIHTLKSRHLGLDPDGHDIWDNTRSEMGGLIYALKYTMHYSNIDKIVKLLSDHVGLNGFDFIIPVPASKTRKLQPVDMIAQALGDQYNIPVQAGFLGNSGGSQLKAIHDPINRAEILKKRITILGADDISGTNVLLIDDVYRSGATLNACAQVLKESAKVTEIWVLTMTKTRTTK